MLLTELPKGEEKMEEEKEYFWATDGDDGPIELLLDSNKKVARLQGRLAQGLRKQKKGSRPLLPNTTETLQQRNKVTSQIKLQKIYQYLAVTSFVDRNFGMYLIPLYTSRRYQMLQNSVT